MKLRILNVKKGHTSRITDDTEMVAGISGGPITGISTTSRATRYHMAIIPNNVLFDTRGELQLIQIVLSERIHVKMSIV